MSMDHRAAAAARTSELIALLRTHGSQGTAAIVTECEALTRAISAFHMEGIRFRMFNVDRLIARGGPEVPAEAAAILEEVRRHLESAGFHTRSHQAPG